MSSNSNINSCLYFHVMNTNSFTHSKGFKMSAFFLVIIIDTENTDSAVSNRSLYRPLDNTTDLHFFLIVHGMFWLIFNNFRVQNKKNMIHFSQLVLLSPLQNLYKKKWL